MTIKQKFSSIDQSKLTSDQKAFLDKIKNATNDFTNREMNKKVLAPLDNFIAKAKEKVPEAIISTPVKISQSKSTKTTKTISKTSQTSKPKRTVMGVAKEIRKVGETFADAKIRASKIMQDDKNAFSKTVETELEKLSKLVRGQKSKSKLIGITKTNLQRDSVRKAKPVGLRKVTQSGETSNQYGTFSNKLGRRYSERRDNRTDRLSPKYPKNAPYLENGAFLDSNFQNISDFSNGGGVEKVPAYVKRRLEELRKEIRAERISYGELAELQSLAKYIDSNDVELLEPAGVSEFEEDDNYANGGGFALYKIQQKFKYALQPKWEDEKFQTGGRKFLTFAQAQDFKKKLQGLSSSMDYKVVKVGEDEYANGGGVKKVPAYVKRRLEEIRKELRAERISYAELLELQSLAQYIDPNDVELLEPAGVPEFGNDDDENEDEYAKGGGLKGKFLAEIKVPYNYEKVVEDKFEFTEYLSKILTKKWFGNGVWRVKMVKSLFEKDYSQRIVVEIDIPVGVTQGGGLDKFDVGELISKTLTKKWFGNGIWGVDIISNFANGCSLPFMTDPNFGNFQNTGSFELGGTFMMTDLAGHTRGLNSNLPLDGFTNTNYSGLVGETGALSSGELFKSGGEIYDINKRNLKRFFRKYEKNEDENMHSENVVLLAENFGTQDEKLKAKRILKIHDEEGSLSTENAKNRRKLSEILIQKARAEMQKNDLKFEFGGDFQSSVYANGGSMMQNQQIIDDASQHYVNYYLGQGASQGIYKKGGKLLSQSERYIDELKGLTGLSYFAITEFIEKNNLSNTDVLHIIVGIGRKQIKNIDVNTAIIGFKNNPEAVKLLKFARSDEAMRMANGGIMDKSVMMARGGKLEVGDMVMVDDSGYVQYFSKFDLSKPAKIISKNKNKVFGKVKYFYGLETADGRFPFNKALEEKLTKVSNDINMMDKGGAVNFKKQTSDDFELGEIVYDVENKDYGTIIGIYDEYLSDKFEVRLDSNGMQYTEYLRKVYSKYDTGTKEELDEAINSYANLIKNYPENNYPKQIQPIIANDGDMMDKGGGIRKKNGRKYPLGRNWTNEHRKQNKNQKFEFPQNERKFMNGGGMETPRIYVADLEAYNKGNLVGEYLDLTDYNDADELMEAIQEVLTKSGGEEYAIHDYENFPSSLYSESMGREDFEKLYEIMDLAKQNDLPLEVVQEIISQFDESAINDFYGKYNDAEDFAIQLVDDLGIESFIDFEYYLEVSETDRRLLSQEMADIYVDDIRDEDGGNRLIEEANMDTETYQEADSEMQEEMLDDAREIVYNQYYDEYYDGLNDPYNFLVKEQGLYDAESFSKANFVRVDYEKLGDALEQDYTFIENDGYLYVFGVR